MLIRGSSKPYDGVLFDRSRIDHVVPPIRLPRAKKNRRVLFKRPPTKAETVTNLYVLSEELDRKFQDLLFSIDPVTCDTTDPKSLIMSVIQSSDDIRLLEQLDDSVSALEQINFSLSREVAITAKRIEAIKKKIEDSTTNTAITSNSMELSKLKSEIRVEMEHIKDLQDSITRIDKRIKLMEGKRSLYKDVVAPQTPRRDHRESIVSTFRSAGQSIMNKKLVRFN